MKRLPLHIKTAIFASLISLIALVLSLLIFSFSAARRFQQEQKQLAILQAQNLAEQLSSNSDLIESESLQNLIEVASGSSPVIKFIRVWRFKDGNFIEIADTDREKDDLTTEALEAEVADALQKNVSYSWTQAAAPDQESIFRVFSPISQGKQLIGAVEVVEQPDTILTIALGYLPNLLWLLFVVFVIMNVSFYLFFQNSIYKPLEGLLSISSDDAKLPAGNEFRILSDKFNAMVAQIREMSRERERQREILQQKIEEATAELKQKKEQLENANLELFAVYRRMREMERLAAAGQITAQLAHEVGTPLNLISGHAQLLKNEFPADSKESRRLNLIIEQIERIEKIVRETLNRTRLDASTHQALNLNALLEKVFEIVEPILQENKIKVELNLAHDLPAILGDPDRLQQVFLNLVSNSLDAMPQGGSIKVSTQLVEDKVVVDFSDTGCGFSEEARANLFRPLFTTKQPGKGTGLGLFVVREILQEHSAEITLESQVGESAHFRIVFKPA